MFRPVDRPLSFRQRASNWIYKVSLNVKNARGLANAEFSMAVDFAKWVNRVCVCAYVCVEGKETKGKRGKTLCGQRFPRHSGESKNSAYCRDLYHFF